MKKRRFHRSPDHGDPAAGGGRGAGAGAVPRARDEQRDVLQMACEVWRHGCVHDRQMKDMEDENRRLKRMYADLSMQTDLLRGGAWKKVTRPSQRREMAEKAVATKGVSIALACRAFGVSETCYRYSPKRDDENEVIADLLVGLTNVHKTWGFGLCFLYLRNVKGHVWNHKRVYRIYCELELNLRIKPRRTAEARQA